MNALFCRMSATVLWCALSLAAGQAASAQAPAPQDLTVPADTYAITHTLTVRDIPAGAKSVRIWFWVPQTDAAQQVQDFTVTQAPRGYRIVKDHAAGMTYLYCEVKRPTASTIGIATQFTLQRQRVKIALDPAKDSPLTDRQRAALAQDLRTDVPHMAVDTTMRDLANKICGSEMDVVRQAHLIYDYVAENTQQYSKSPSAPPSSQEGDAAYCLAKGGGACTDMHSLFCALARARGIPARIDFGSLLREPNLGKTVDPGYRCWALFYAPGYGWVPADMAAASLAPQTESFYFGGLDAHRILFSRGRDLTLTPKQDGPPVNLFIGAYVEVDGKPYTAFDRRLTFTRASAQSAKLP